MTDLEERARRRERRGRTPWLALLGFIVFVVAVIAAVVFVLEFLGHVHEGATNYIPPQATSAPSILTPSGPSSTNASAQPSPLPSGIATPIAPPQGGTYHGYTAGDLDYDLLYAPAYTVNVPTATVTKEWGFTYTYSCDSSADDVWRQSHPGQGAFSIQLGSTYLVIGSTYNGSGYVSVKSSSGYTVHILKVSGPCSYQLNYYNYN